MTTWLDIAPWDYLLAYLSLLLTIATYWGVHYLNIFEQRRQLHALRNKEAGEGQVSVTNDKPKRLTKKSNSNIEQLHRLMAKEQLYLNPALTRSIFNRCATNN